MSVESLESYLAKGGGEGSRGGKVIGHHSNGKPIYASASWMNESHIKHAETREHGSYHVEDHGANQHGVYFTGKGAKKPKLQGYASSVDHAKAGIEHHSKTGWLRPSSIGGDGANPDAKWLSKKSLASFDALIDYMQKGGGEGSRGGHIIGHTSGGKPVYDSKHESYQRAEKPAKFNSEIKPTSSHHDQNGRMVRQRFADYDKQDHKDAASAHAKEAQTHEKAHQELRAKAEKKHYGGHLGGASMPHISGGVDPKFPKATNNKLRDHAHRATEHKTLAEAHKRAARSAKPTMQGKTFEELHGGPGGMIEKLKDKDGPKVTVTDRTPEGYGPGETKKSEAQEKTMDSYKSLESYLAKADGGLPSGNPGLEGGNPANGGKVAGVGAPTGSNTAPSPAAKASPEDEKKLSEDDGDGKTLGSQPKLGKSEDYSQRALHEGVARTKAVAIQKLQKAKEPEIVTAGVGVPDPKVERPVLAKARGRMQGSDSRVLYTEGGIDDAASTLAKGDGFYTGSAPQIDNRNALMKSQLCKSCGAAYSKSLTACSKCGKGAVMAKATIEGRGDEIALTTHGQPRQFFQKAKRDDMLTLPHGTRKAQV